MREPWLTARSCSLYFGSQVARHLGVDAQSGLSLLEVSVRQGLVPPNELEQEEEVSSRRCATMLIIPLPYTSNPIPTQQYE